MQIERLAIPDVILIRPTVFDDARGSFFETYNAGAFAEATGAAPDFIQDNHSVSARGVVRGLHYQTAPHAQGKLVRVAAGEVFDVAVDLRPESPTFGKWVGVTLSAANRQQLWIPPGFAHGFMALADQTEFLYKVSGRWSRAHERSLLWNDPGLNIEWPAIPPVLSQKDVAAPSWEETRRAILSGDLQVGVAA